MSSFVGKLEPGAGNGIPMRPSKRAGVNKRSESQRRRHESPTCVRFEMTNDNPARAGNSRPTSRFAPADDHDLDAFGIALGLRHPSPAGSIRKGSCLR